MHIQQVNGLFFLAIFPCNDDGSIEYCVRQNRQYFSLIDDPNKQKLKTSLLST